ncbi:MAG: SDR family NAD(P)-dependent oxidoreductase [Candidatus Binatia bacterium]
MGLLEGKVAVVTGAARGIGRAVAELMVEHGASVVINDVDEELALVAVQELKRSGAAVESVTGSVTDSGFAARLLSATVEAFGRFDIIVNNAGYTWDGVIHKMTDEQWEAMIDCHLTAPFRIMREASRYWIDQAKQELTEGKLAHRKVVNVSSTSGVAGNAGQVNYAAGKMGIVGVTKSLAKEWGRYGVNVNAVAYGFIDTRLTSIKDGAHTQRFGDRDVSLGIPERIREAAIARIPLGRPGTVREAAGPVVFLSSSLSDYVSGTVTLVTGGSYT